MVLFLETWASKLFKNYISRSGTTYRIGVFLVSAVSLHLSPYSTMLIVRFRQWLQINFYLLFFLMFSNSIAACSLISIICNFKISI
jgi:hypothetical protein